MNQIIELLGKVLDAVVNGAAHIFHHDLEPMIFYTSHSFTAASETVQKTIELPANAKGWIIDGMFCEPTTTDFTVDISRSGRGGTHLTSGRVPSVFVLPKRSTFDQSVLSGFDAESKETLTFDMQNGSTAANPVKIGLIARKKK